MSVYEFSDEEIAAARGAAFDKIQERRRANQSDFSPESDALFQVMRRGPSRKLLVAEGRSQFPLMILVREKCHPWRGYDGVAMSRSWVEGSDVADNGAEGMWDGRRHVFLEAHAQGAGDDWSGYGWRIREATAADLERDREERGRAWRAIP